MTAWWWTTVALDAVAAVASGVRMAVEMRAGRRFAWIWGMSGAVFVFALGSKLHDARWG